MAAAEAAERGQREDLELADIDTGAGGVRSILTPSPPTSSTHPPTSNRWTHCARLNRGEAGLRHRGACGGARGAVRPMPRHDAAGMADGHRARARRAAVHARRRTGCRGCGGVRGAGAAASAEAHHRAARSFPRLRSRVRPLVKQCLRGWTAEAALIKVCPFSRWGNFSPFSKWDIDVRGLPQRPVQFLLRWQHPTLKRCTLEKELSGELQLVHEDT
jgi:hypothetical protein